MKLINECANSTSIKVIIMASNLITKTVHQLAKAHLHEHAIAIDATVGNGNDTLFLALNARKVIGFDVQEKALQATQALLRNHYINHVSLIHDSHENLDIHVTEKVDVIVFNLGYLPKGDKSVTTMASSTLVAIEKSLNVLLPGGICIVVVYTGHPEGKLEDELIRRTSPKYRKLGIQIMKHALVHNTASPPYILTFHKS